MKKIKAIVLLPLAIVLLFCSCNNTNEEEPRIYSVGSPAYEEAFDPYAFYEVPAPSDFGQDPFDPYLSERLHLVQGTNHRLFVWTPEGFTAMPLGYESLDDLPALDTSINRKYQFNGRPVAGDMALTFGLTINDASFGHSASTSERHTSVWDRYRNPEIIIP